MYNLFTHDNNSRWCRKCWDTNIDHVTFELSFQDSLNKIEQINKGVQKIKTWLISTDTSEGLNVAVHMFVFRVVGKHNPSKSDFKKQSCILLLLPVDGGGLDVNSVPIVAAVTVSSQGAASPHSHSVHVIPDQEGSPQVKRRERGI